MSDPVPGEPSACQPDVEPFDAVVIGTGFGGAVAACRLAEAKKRICILERGRRYGAGDFPRPAQRPDKLPHTARWAWSIDHGLWDVKDLQGTLAIQAAGYGGGSLVYANVHLRPPPEVFSAENGWPRCYSRAALDRYYDVVAAALRVQPFPSPPPPASKLTGELPKIDAMQEAAKALDRTRWLFRPPLAIDFEKCVMCGECIAGCQIQAKNTLDLNYLEAAERVGDIDVRTLAEVSHIEEQGDRYIVHYTDHIAVDETATVAARSVFLCAGSVNSTHILLRSARKGLKMEGERQIGQRFFANGDAIAMVFETSDTKAPPTPTLGPTITSALLYNERPPPLLYEACPPGVRSQKQDWFLLQDGGYPEWLQQYVGAFRGNFWLGRNRIERARTSRGRARRAAVPTGGSEQLERTLYGLVKTGYGFWQPLQTYLEGRAASKAGLRSILPRQIADQLWPDLKERLAACENEAASTFGDEILEETLQRVIESKPPYLRGLFEWLARIAGDEVRGTIPVAAVDVMNRHVFDAAPRASDPLDGAALGRLAAEAATRLFLGPPPTDRAFVMLTMGMDRAPGRLDVDEDHRLVAEWNLAANTPFNSKEERLMHDVANALGGEMRLNPDSIARQRPISVHSLGGCAMSDDPACGVTDSSGKVHGTRALYVVDGAAIPGPLGTNPSATIAAIAERNVRMALAEMGSPLPLPGPDDPPLPYGAKTVRQIREELGQTEEVLDPMASRSLKAREPDARAVGLEFTEVMRGFYTVGGQPNLPIRVKLDASIGDLSAFLADPRRSVEMTGKVFMPDGPAGKRTEYDARGTLDLLKRVEPRGEMISLLDYGRELLAIAEKSSSRPDIEAEIDFLLRRLEKHGRKYRMDYDLELHAAGGKPTFRLIGEKKIQPGPPLAAWTDTMTLPFKVLALDEPPTTDPVANGTMHVHIADFLDKQLPSFQVTGTGDDLRIAWAFGRFFRFFLGTLRKVYFPRIQMIDPAGDRRV